TRVPPRDSRNAHSTAACGLVEAAAPEKAEECKHEHDDQNDPKQAHLCSFHVLCRLTRPRKISVPGYANATPSGVTIVASEAYNQGDEARSTPGADRAGGRRGRRPGRAVPHREFS